MYPVAFFTSVRERLCGADTFGDSDQLQTVAYAKKIR